MWAGAALRAEEQLADVPRAIADHRRAAVLGEGASAVALARLLLARGDHAAAARVLEDLCEQASPEALPALALRLTDAYLAANDPDAARERLMVDFSWGVLADNLADDTWAAAAEIYDRARCVNLSVLVSFTALICNLMDAFQLELPPGAEPLLPIP